MTQDPTWHLEAIEDSDGAQLDAAIDFPDSSVAISIAGPDIFAAVDRFAELIVPVALETTAEQELKSIFYADSSNKVATASMRNLEIISEARLDNGIDNKAVGAAVAGSALSWYLAASPAQIDTVELAYLEGQRGVYIETRQGFDVDGLEIKARLDVGAKTMDHRGLLKNAGA